MDDYTVRYRCDDGRGGVLLVEDDQGRAYLFSQGALQLRLSGADASARLAGLLARRAPCTPVSAAPPYKLAGLRRVAQTPPGHEDSVLCG